MMKEYMRNNNQWNNTTHDIMQCGKYHIVQESKYHINYP